MKKSSRYIHDFASCSRTYATLCIYHNFEDSKNITDLLELTPSRAHNVGDLRHKRTAQTSGWFLGTKDILTSRDLRAHIEWILDALVNKKEQLNSLLESGHELWISCFWESASGNGGPILDHEVITYLSEFPLELHFDVWFDVGEDQQ
jgi:hypothetical protein